MTRVPLLPMSAFEFVSETTWSSALPLLDAVGDSVCLLDQERRIVWVNSAGARAAAAFGVVVHEVLGTPFEQALPFAADPRLVAAIDQALLMGPGASSQAIELSIPGSGRRARVRVLAIPGAVAVIARERTDERTVQRMQTAHETRYRTLFDAVPMPLVVIERSSGTVLATNRAMAGAFVLHGPLVGRPGSMVFSEECLAMLVREPEEGRRMRVSQAACALQRGDGSVLDAEVEAFTLDFGGRAAVLATVRDVTEARKAEAERLLLRAAVARINDLIVITSATPDADGALPIVFVNEAFERHTGWHRDEVMGRPGSLLDGPGTDASLIARVHEHLRRGETIRAEVLQYTREGREYWAELVVVPVLDGAGVPTHWVSVHRDVSDRKQLEEQLFQSQKMEAVGRLAGGVAHDFNNVLTAISGFSELLLEELPVGEGPHDEVLQIKAAAARATALTRQLLAFSRKQILRPRLVDVGALVRNVERLLERAVTEEVVIRLHVAEFTSPVLADSVQLEQVLLNLAVNASEAMPDGGSLMIEVSDIALGESYAHRHHGVQPGHYVCLTVSDTGVGMDRATRERIWEPFFTTKSGGTGLGLSTVYGIVRQSGGHVWVYSEPGTGTTFKIYLPVSTSEVPDEAVEDQPASALGGSETILVVEDEALVRNVTRAMLARRGYTVLVASDGDHAQRIASEHFGTIDLLLTDVVMPRANGRRVAERLRMMRPGLRVVYMSGYTEDAIVHHGVLEAGIVLLEKPFTEADLARTVRAVLDAPQHSD
jgi:two-component system, cell cycle sensor histidine kinase and response regulator CckA